MQATVATFDAETRSGSVLLDDGREILFDHVAFDAGGLRTLRFGQRVRIDVDDPTDRSSETDEPLRPRIRSLTLATLPLPARRPDQ